MCCPSRDIRGNIVFPKGRFDRVCLFVFVKEGLNTIILGSLTSATETLGTHTADDPQASRHTPAEQAGVCVCVCVSVSFPLLLKYTRIHHKGAVLSPATTKTHNIHHRISAPSLWTKRSCGAAFNPSAAD